jgi:hypothetical protein
MDMPTRAFAARATPAPQPGRAKQAPSGPQAYSLDNRCVVARNESGHLSDSPATHEVRRAETFALPGKRYFRPRTASRQSG